MTTAILIAAGYLAGSVPFGYWLPRLFRGEDIRTLGSRNVGGTNVMRVFGPRLGFVVLLLDFAKGVAPALVASLIVDDLAGVLAGAAAMAAHWRPPFLGFARGGKMIATGGGAFLALAPLVALGGLGIWLVVFAVRGYASLASIVAAASMAGVSVLLGESWPIVAFAAIAGAAAIALHRTNIERLIKGTESRFDLKAWALSSLGRRQASRRTRSDP